VTYSVVVLWSATYLLGGSPLTDPSVLIQFPAPIVLFLGGPVCSVMFCCSLFCILFEVPMQALEVCGTDQCSAVTLEANFSTVITIIPLMQ